MRYYTLSNCNLAVPDEVVYLSDSIMVRADYPSPEQSRMRVTIDNNTDDTLTAQLTASTVAILDLSYYLRSHYQGNSRISVRVQIWTQVQGVQTTDSIDITLKVMYGKSYQERTHYAEGAVYLPDAAPYIEIMTPLPATVTNSDGETVTTPANEVVEVKGECITSLTVDFARDNCIGDCGWAHGITAIHLYAKHPNSALTYRLILVPQTELEVWRITSQSSIPLPNNYLHAPLTQGFMWGNPAATYSEYNAAGVLTGDKWEIIIDLYNPMYIYIDYDAAEALFGLSPNGEVVQRIQVATTEEGGASLSVQTLTDTYNVKIPACPSYRYISTMLYNRGFTAPTCRHTVDVQGVMFVTFGDTTPDGLATNVYALAEIAQGWNLYTPITDNGGETYKGGSTWEMFLPDTYTGTQTFEVYNRDGTIDDVTYDTATLVYHFLAPSCYGYFERGDGVQCPPISYHPATGDMVARDGAIIHAVSPGISLLDIWEELRQHAGVTTYTDQLGRTYTYRAESACCDELQITIRRGTLWCSEEVERYTIEVRRGCQRDCRGLWLNYYNADGLQRWLPVEIYSETTSRERYDYRQYLETPERWLPASYTTATGRTIEVVAKDIDDKVFIADLLTSPTVYLFDNALTTAISVAIQLDELTVEADGGGRDYLIKLKTLS